MKKKSALDQLDDFLENKKDSEQQFIFFVAFAFIVFVIYMGVFPLSQSYFDEKKDAHDKITKSLNDANAYLDSMSGPGRNDRNYAINQEKFKLNNKKSFCERLQNTNKYFDAKLTEVSSITYSEKNWAAFLDSLTAMASENNIKLFSLDSEQKGIDLKKVQEVLNIRLSFQGTFNNVLKYINSIEQSKMVVDVNGLDINSTGSEIGGSMKISVWGMKY